MAIEKLSGMIEQYPQISDIHFWAQFPGESVDMMHETIAVLEALELVDLGTIHRLRDLATDVEHADGPDEIGQLMKRASSWLEPVWPLIAMVMSGQLSESHESGTTHEDFIP